MNEIFVTIVLILALTALGVYLAENLFSRFLNPYQVRVLMRSGGVVVADVTELTYKKDYAGKALNWRSVNPSEKLLHVDMDEVVGVTSHRRLPLLLLFLRDLHVHRQEAKKR